MKFNFNINKSKIFILVFLTGAFFFTLLSIFSYHPTDPSFTIQTSEKFPHVNNLCGIIGAYLSDIFFKIFGFVSFLIPFSIIFYLYKIIKEDEINIIHLLKEFLFIFYFLIMLSIFINIFKYSAVTFREGSVFIGGFLGHFVDGILLRYFNIYGSVIIIIIFLLISVILVFKINLEHIKLFYERVLLFIKFIIEKLKRNQKTTSKASNKEKKQKKKKNTENKEKERTTKKEKSGDEEQADEADEVEEDIIPSEDFLVDPPEEENKTDNEEYLNKKKEILLEKLGDFGITGEVVNVITGPVVTLFEFEPSPGIKLSKITSLTDDLTMALRALSVRVIAPIPGKSVVGIEIPNEIRKVVFFKEIIKSQEFKKDKHPLTIALGKTVDGTPYVSNLSKMPHLLVAGSTGSGKSVCINTILISILYRATEKDVRFILVDPKMLELSVYNGIPHLYLPVIIDPEKAAIALRWAIGEMERRYELLANTEVREISEYNKKVSINERLPYIVIVIDELADLMMIAPKDVETSIARLAQKARAAGIHLILATQRPSVDVITGVIKNNLPSRIAFKVTSRADSRTIIDSMGAEALLGYGDMLFIPPGSSSPVRLQGAFISNDEILKVTEYLKKRGKTEYREEDILNYEPENKKRETIIFDESDSGDALYREVKEFVKTLDTVSISMLQRRFKIGFNKSATIMEKLEEEGIVGPPDGSKPRKVLVRNA